MTIYPLGAFSQIKNHTFSFCYGMQDVNECLCKDRGTNVCVCVLIYLLALFLGLVSAGVLGRWRGSLSAPFRWVILSWITSLMFLIHSCLASILDAWRRNPRVAITVTPHTGTLIEPEDRKLFSFKFNFFSLTFSTVLLSEDGVLPAHRANLHGSPSMCSVTPNSDVCRMARKEEYRMTENGNQWQRTICLIKTHSSYSSMRSHT